MSAITESAVTQHKGVGGWCWAGRIFLALLLGFTVMPMFWMVITSLKTGFAHEDDAVIDPKPTPAASSTDSTISVRAQR